MNDLILDNLIKEKRDITNISYILEDSSLFFEIGYKVLQNQEKNDKIILLNFFILFYRLIYRLQM